MNEPDETEHLIERWREKYANILTPDEEELGNQKEEEAKHPKHGRRGEGAQDQRSEDMDPTTKKQRIEDEPLTTQVQGGEDNAQNDEKLPKNNMNRTN